MSDGTHPGTETQTHRRIILAALHEFTQSGYKGCSTRAVAERAGVNEVTLFRHFGNKLELLRAAVEYSVGQMRAPADIESYFNLSLRDGLTKLITDYLLQLSSQSDILMLGFSESFSHPEVADVLRRFIWQFRTALIQYFEGQYAQKKMKEADFPVLAHMLLITIHSTPSVHKRAPEDVKIHLSDERVVKTLVDTVSLAYSLDEL